MSAKRFLLQECRNVRALLNDTLRHEYGLDGSRTFFEECSTRLEFITTAIDQLQESEHSLLEVQALELNLLTQLICRIERSSLGEYSWPFVESLKEMADAACTEDTLTEKDVPPKVFVLAEGGLDAYAIHTERRRPSTGKRLLLTIFFPKTLKDFVLLHPILGHELGHAIWRCSKHQAHIGRKVLPALCSAGIFTSPQSVAAHLCGPSAPPPIQQELARTGLTAANFFHWASWNAWVEELLCDLVGLVTFGPTFVAAECELLRALVPSGLSIGRAHPPVAWRLNLILRGAEMLQLDQHPEADHRHFGKFQSLWSDLKSFNATDPWHQVFDDAAIRTALDELTRLLDPLFPARYPTPDLDVLSGLLDSLEKLVPPVAASTAADGAVHCPAVDFRHILYAGWLSRRGMPENRFDVLNRLCQHGMMQQRAIDLYLKRRAA